MADKEIKRLLENLFSDIPVETVPEATPPEAAIEAEKTSEPAPHERPDLDEDSGAPPEDGALAEQMRHRTLQLQAASEISTAAASILDLDELLSLVVELIRDRFELYYTGVFLLDREEQYAVLQAGTGKAGQQMVQEGHRLETGGGSMIGQCVATGQAHIALDVGEEAVRFSNPLLPKTRSEMAIPLVSRGTAIGAMTIQSDQPAAFSKEDVTVLQSMADQLANSIENARLFEQRERRISELAVVNEISQALTSTLQLDTLLETVHLQVSRIFDTANFYIATYEEGSDEWASAFHLEGGKQQPLARYSIATGLTGHIIRTRQPVLFRSIADNIRFKEEQGIEIIGEMARSWLGVPLIASDKIVGVMGIQNYDHEGLYGDQELSLFSTVASQVANALENLRLFAEAQRRAEQTQRLLAVSEASASTLESTEVMRRVARAAAGAMDADTTAAYVLDGTGAKLLPVAGYHVPPKKLDMYRQAHIPVEGNPFVQEALAEQRTVFASDAATDARYSGTLLSQLMPARSALLAPMIAKDAVIGVLFAVWWEEPHNLTREEQGLVEGIMRQAAIAIESARLFEQTQRQLEELTTISRLGQTLATAALQPEEIVAATARQFVEVMGVPEASISLLDPQEGMLRIMVDFLRDPASALIRQDDTFQEFYLIDYPATARAMETMQPLVVHISDPDADPAELAYMKEYEVTTLVVIPMVVKGRSIGVIELEAWDQERYYTPGEINLAMALASQTAVALENARLFEEAQARARHERILRQITTRVRGSTDPDTVMRAAVRELGTALGRPAFIRLGSDGNGQATPEGGE